MTEALNFRLNLDIQDLDPASPPTTFKIEELPKKKVGTMWDPDYCSLLIDDVCKTGLDIHVRDYLMIFEAIAS